jgi:hypothetical protein
LNPDFRDMLSALSEEKVEYLVVGAHALAVHGYPRATGDIDIWIRSSTANATRVYRALARFGAPLAGISEEDFEAPGSILQIGVAPRRIDLLTSISGVDFDDAWGARIVAKVEGPRAERSWASAPRRDQACAQSSEGSRQCCLARVDRGRLTVMEGSDSWRS